MFDGRTKAEEAHLEVEEIDRRLSRSSGLGEKGLYKLSLIAFLGSPIFLILIKIQNFVSS